MIYLDTNAFYLFFFEEKKYSPGVKKIFEKIQRGEEKGLTSCLTLDELAYVVLMRLIEKKYGVHPANKLREDPGVILEFLPMIKEMFEAILSFDNLEIAGVDRNLVAVIPELMENLLLPRDCIHLQTMRDHGCDKILSTDPDFDRIEGIERVKPEEV